MSKKKNQIDLSALLEVEPHQTDDRTSALKTEEIRRAHREAKKVLSSQNKSFGSTLLQIFGFLILIFVLGGAIYFASTMDLQNWINKTFRKLPILEDLSDKDNDILNSIAKTSLEIEGPKLKLAVSKSHMESPIVYIATNLPQGFVLNFVLTGKLGQILSTTPVELRLPITIVKNLGKTPSLQLKNGKTLPAGQYQAILYNDDEQPSTIKPLLAQLPEVAGPSNIVPMGRKIIYSEQILLGNVNHNEISTKLTQFRTDVRSGAENELKLIKLGTEFFESLLQNTTSTSHEIYTKVKKRDARNKWNEYHSHWNADQPILKSKIVHYPSAIITLQEIQKDLQSLHEKQNQLITSQRITKESISQISQIEEQIKQKLIRMKNWIKTTELDFSNPQFLPKLGNSS